MAKNSKRRRLAASAIVNKAAAIPNTAINDEVPFDSDLEEEKGENGSEKPLVSAMDLAITARTLALLASQDSIETLRGKELKAVKTATYELMRVLNGGGSLTSQISAALSDARWLDALVLLSELSLRGGKTKLGALQRWVRECDAAAVAQHSKKGKAKATEQDEGEMVMRVLDAILRVAGEDQALPVENMVSTRNVVQPRAEWVCPGAESAEPVRIWDRAKTNALFESDAERVKLANLFRVVSTTAGKDRKPPNRFPAVVHHCLPGSIQLDANDVRTGTVERHNVPGVQGAFLLTNVLSPAECLSVCCFH